MPSDPAAKANPDQWKPPEGYTLDPLNPDQWKPPAGYTLDAAPAAATFGQGFMTGLGQYGSGFYGALAGTNRMVSNVAGLLDQGAEQISKATGMSKGGAFGAIRDWARAQAGYQQQRAEELAAGQNDLLSKVVRGGTQGLLELPIYAGAGELLGVPAGMASIGAIRESDQGWLPALKAAAEGAVLGKALEVIQPGSLPIRLTGASAMGYAQAKLNGADDTEALAAAATMGGMAGMGGPGGVSARDIYGPVATGVTAPVRAVGGKAIDVAGGVNPAMREAIGVIWPGAKNALDFAARVKKAKDAYVAEAAKAQPEAPATAAKPAPPEPTTASSGPTVTGISDEAVQQLYRVETDPAKRTALKSEMQRRGLATEPAPPAPTPIEQNPYRRYTQSALQKVYQVEQSADKRALMEQAAQDRGLTLLNREGRRATVAPPETGYQEAAGPSMTQDDALILKFLGEDPATADAKTIAAARQIAAEQPGVLDRLRKGLPVEDQGLTVTPEQPAANVLDQPQIVPQPPSAEGIPVYRAAEQPPLEANILRKKAAAEAPEQPPPPTAVPTPPEPATAPAAQSPGTVEALTQYVSNAKIPAHIIDKFEPQHWQAVADAANTPMPTAEEIAQIKTNLGGGEPPASTAPGGSPGGPAPQGPGARQGQRLPPGTTAVETGELEQLRAGQMLPLPEGVPAHYRAVQLRDGTTEAVRAFLKDQRIARYVLDQGITPEQWEAMTLDEQNALVREAPSKSGKAKHMKFVEQPEPGAVRDKYRWAHEGVKDIADTMRWIEEQEPAQMPPSAAKLPPAEAEAAFQRAKAKNIKK